MNMHIRYRQVAFISRCRLSLLAFAFMIAALLCGCRVGPNFRPIKAPVNDTWKALNDQRIKGEPVNSREWWKVFNDPVLDGLIEQACERNLTLQAAGLRIIQSRVVRAGAVWAYLPLVTLSGNASHLNFSENLAPEVTVKRGSAEISRRLSGIFSQIFQQNVNFTLPELTVKEMDLYRADMDAIWELDVWGKDQRRIEAATGELAASIAEYDAAIVSLTGEVAAAYTEIRSLQRQLSVARENIATFERISGIVRGRREKNIVTDLDVDLMSILLNDLQASVPALEAALTAAENGLCVLLGKAPYDIAKELGDSARIPRAPKEVGIGAPADLLRRRPDVRAAERLAAAQSARIGLAKSRLYPTFSLFGSLGLASSRSSMFFESESVRGAYGGLFSWSILIYPILQENVRLQDAMFQETVANYKQTVLAASKEVEDAATFFVKAQDRLPLLTESAEASRRAIQRASDQYERGVTPFATVVDSAQFLVQNTDRAIRAQSEVALTLIATYKALGGGWEIREDKEVVPDDIKEQMRKETDWRTFDGPRVLSTKKLLSPAK